MISFEFEKPPLHTIVKNKNKKWNKETVRANFLKFSSTIFGFIG